MTNNNSEITVAELARVFKLQQRQQWASKASTAQQRIATLIRLKASIKHHEKSVIDALYQDLRKPARAVKNDLHICYAEIDDAAANLEHWMAPQEVATSPMFAKGRAQVVSESLGVVLLFGPWNFPFHLVFQPLIAILAAGNCAIVKPNEMAPATSMVVTAIIKDVFDEGQVAVFEGGVALANQLLELPVNHVFFTGSPVVGKQVMKAAAQHLASVTLELGGKNPVVIDRSADLVDAATKIATYRVMNSGQLCLCPENVWVPRELLDNFVDTVKSVFTKCFYVENEINPDATGKIIDSRNFTRVLNYINDARDKGARVACGGVGYADLNVIEPTLLLDIPSDALILQEEVFGPVLSIFAYDKVDDVVTNLQQQPKPLAMYVFARDQQVVDRLLSQTSSGGVTVNDCLMHCVEHNLPFGGVNNSGMGAYHGVHGFNELSHQKSVLYPRSIEP